MSCWRALQASLWRIQALIMLKLSLNFDGASKEMDTCTRERKDWEAHTVAARVCHFLFPAFPIWSCYQTGARFIYSPWILQKKKIDFLNLTSLYFVLYGHAWSWFLKGVGKTTVVVNAQTLGSLADVRKPTLSWTILTSNISVRLYWIYLFFYDEVINQ